MFANTLFLNHTVEGDHVKTNWQLVFELLKESHRSHNDRNLRLRLKEGEFDQLYREGRGYKGNFLNESSDADMPEYNF